MLHARERRRIDAGLKLALNEHRVSDVHDEADAAQHEDEGNARDDEDLPALIGGARKAALLAPPGVETVRAHARTERHRPGDCHPSIWLLV